MRAVAAVLWVVVAGAGAWPVASAQEKKSPSEWIRQMKYGRTPQQRSEPIREEEIAWIAAMDAIRDPDPGVRRCALHFYASSGRKWGNRTRARVFLEAANDSDRKLRLFALNHLTSGTGSAPAVLLLARAESDGEAAERDEARAALGHSLRNLGFREDEAPQLFFDAPSTGGPDAMARSRVVRALIDWLHTKQPGLPGLLERMDDPDPRVRRAATRFVRNVLFGTKPGRDDLRPEHLRAVVARLRDEDAAVRVAALGVLEVVRRRREEAEWVPVEEAVRGLVPLLADPDETTREYALAALDGWDRTGASNELIRSRLADPSWKVRRAALWAIDARGSCDSATFQAILPLLDDPKGEVRKAAVEAIGRCGRAAREAGPRLTAILRDPEQCKEVGYEALCALAALGPPDQAALEIVCTHLRGNTIDWGAYRVVAGLGPEQAWAAPRLVALLADPELSNADRQAVLSGLAGIGVRARRAFPVVRRFLSSEDPHLRLHALMAAKRIMGLGKPTASEVIALLGESVRELADSGPEPTPWSEDISGLTDALDDPRAAVRAWAAGRIRHWKGSIDAAVPALIRRLGDHDESVASRAAWALRHAASSASVTVPALMRVLEASPREQTRRDISGVLGAFGPDARLAAPLLVGWLDDSELCTDASDALEAIGSGALEALRAVKHSRSESVRVRATYLLGWIGGPALADLLDLLADSHPAIRATAAWWVRRQGPRAMGSEARLLPLVRDEYAFVRVAAVEALGRIAPDAEIVLDALLQATRDDYGFVRFEAVRSIRALGPDAAPAMPRLVEILETDWEHIRFEAARALGAIGRDAASARPALERAAREGSPAVRLAAERALSTIHR